jgi:hypothetical protein
MHRFGNDTHSGRPFALYPENTSTLFGGDEYGDSGWFVWKQ